MSRGATSRPEDQKRLSLAHKAAPFHGITTSRDDLTAGVDDFQGRGESCPQPRREVHVDTPLRLVDPGNPRIIRITGKYGAVPKAHSRTTLGVDDRRRQREDARETSR